MANATPAHSLGQPLPARSFQAANRSTPRTTTSASTPSGKPFGAPESRAARAAAQAKRDQWASLNLRQAWADEAFMRDHLRMAGLRVTVSAEPATVNRVKTKLRSVGVQSPEIQAAIGMPLSRWLASNPGLPLWAALALVLESAGRFTPEACGDAAPDAMPLAPPFTIVTVPGEICRTKGIIKVSTLNRRRPLASLQADRALAPWRRRPSTRGRGCPASRSTLMRSWHLFPRRLAQVQSQPPTGWRGGGFKAT
jgi:hypothetical protein